VAQFGSVPQVALATGGVDEHDRAPAQATARDALAGLWRVVLAGLGR
jgi:hypothetical protein